MTLLLGMGQDLVIQMLNRNNTKHELFNIGVLFRRSLEIKFPFFRLIMKNESCLWRQHWWVKCDVTSFQQLQMIYTLHSCMSNLSFLIKLYKRQPFLYSLRLMSGTTIQILTSFCTTFTMSEKCYNTNRTERYKSSSITRLIVIETTETLIVTFQIKGTNRKRLRPCKETDSVQFVQQSKTSLWQSSM